MSLLSEKEFKMDILINQQNKKKKLNFLLRGRGWNRIDMNFGNKSVIS
jgi:hypothetical protein